jgi:hypothetical protein
VQWISERKEVDARQIDTYGEGASGVVILHAAALDPRIRRVTIDHALSSYQSILDARVHRKVAESVVPNALLHYDLDDMMIALAPRAIMVKDPIDTEGNLMTQAAFEQEFSRVDNADKSMTFGNRLEFSASGTAGSITHP